MHEVGVVDKFYPFSYLERVASLESISHIFELCDCSRPNVNMVILALHLHLSSVLTHGGLPVFILLREILGSVLSLDLDRVAAIRLNIKSDWE